MSVYVDQTDIRKAVEILKNGGLILYPTDSIWGIGCDATNAEAIERVYSLKGRKAEKSLIVLLENDYMLQSYVQEVPEVAYQLIECAEKPLTIIYDGAKNLPSNLVAADGSIGIRLVKHPFCERLLQQFKRPIVSTSANISGQAAPQTFHDITEEIKAGVDYVVAYGQTENQPKQASSIMKLDASGKFSFIRR